MIMTVMGMATTGFSEAGSKAGGHAYPELHAAMERLKQEKPMTIAFFGGSITWGATPLVEAGQRYGGSRIGDASH